MAPNMNAFAERWVRAFREECLERVMLFGMGSLGHVLKDYVAFHNHERNHQGLGNRLLPGARPTRRWRLGGLLRYYGKVAA